MTESEKEAYKQGQIDALKVILEAIEIKNPSVEDLASAISAKLGGVMYTYTGLTETMN